MQLSENIRSPVIKRHNLNNYAEENFVKLSEI